VINYFQQLAHLVYQSYSKHMLQLSAQFMALLEANMFEWFQVARRRPA
jgi:hypothetical protein